MYNAAISASPPIQKLPFTNNAFRSGNYCVCLAIFAAQKKSSSKQIRSTFTNFSTATRHVVAFDRWVAEDTVQPWQSIDFSAAAYFFSKSRISVSKTWSFVDAAGAAGAASAVFLSVLISFTIMNMTKAIIAKSMTVCANLP